MSMSVVEQERKFEKVKIKVHKHVFSISHENIVLTKFTAHIYFNMFSIYFNDIFESILE